MWGLGGDDGAFCNEQFVGDKQLMARSFRDVSQKLSEGVTGTSLFFDKDTAHTGSYWEACADSTEGPDFS